MKYKIGFQLGVLETVFILLEVFFAGLMCASSIKHKYIYVGLLVLSAGLLLLKRRVKIPF